HSSRGDVYVPIAADATELELPPPPEPPHMAASTMPGTPTSMRSVGDLDDDLPGGLPTLSDPHLRAPALTDLYPRVKTPTSVPPIGAMPEDLAGTPRTARPRLATPLPVFDEDARDVEPALDLEALGADKPWPEQLQPLASSQLDEELAQMLLVYEREIATVDDSAQSAMLRIEAGRLCERLADIERARSHYDAALLADPRAT